MKFEKWKNQYMNLVHSMPDYIVNFDGDCLTEDAVALINQKKKQFKVQYCELGSGSGGHLIELATRDSGALFAGFELRFKRAFRTAEKAAEGKLDNVVVIRGNVATLPRLFSPGSLAGIYVNFPDPWDRAKWKKHRMLSEESLRGLAGTLKPGGFIRYKTDHEGYFHDVLRIIEGGGVLSASLVVSDLHNFRDRDHLPSEALVRSEFEKLFHFKKLPVFFAEFRKS